MAMLVGETTADHAARPPAAPLARRAADWLDGILNPASAALALLGGLVLVAFMTVSVGSIASRVVFGSPLLGDYELVERGSAIAIFAILPYTHIKGGNVVVDMFVGMMAPAVRRFATLASEVAFGVIMAIITWRLALGGMEMYEYHDASMMLQIPTWWVFVPMVLSSALLTLVCVQRSLAALSGTLAPSGGEA